MVDESAGGAMNIGLVGFGRWGSMILRDLIALGATVHVADPLVTRQHIALEHGAVSACYEASCLPDLDGFIVAAPSRAHAAVVESLLARGRPVFVEKPLTVDLLSAERILAKAAHQVFCMDKWRYHGGVRKLAELAKLGALGEVMSVQSWRLSWNDRKHDVDAIWILAPHDLAIALEILGHLPPVYTAFSLSSDPVGQSITALLKDRQSDPSVCLEVSTSHPVPRRSVVVIGSRGAAQLADSYDDYILLNRVDEPPVRIAIDTAMPLQSELRAFLHYLHGGPPPRSSAADAVLIVRRISEMRAMAGLAV